MILRFTQALLLVVVLFGAGWSALPAYAQNNAPAADEAREAARRQILESDRWRRSQRDLNEWLSIQRLYSPDEVATLRSQFQARVEAMSPAELQDHLEDLEEKLAVLTSHEAEDARRWVAQFLSVARNAEEQLRRKRPDIANMTASQIRRELEQFQQRRGTTQQTQAAAQLGRTLQVQSAQGIQSARQQSNEAARRTANPPIVRQPNAAAGRENLPGHSKPPESSRPYYTVGPWGNPILWDPLAGFW